MCGNRVEELESRVKELEASVEGLTDELVECKVRLRELENAVDEDLEFGSDDEDAPAEPDDVPAGGSGGGVDSHKSEHVEGENDREESDSDSDSDIIVA